MSTEPTKRAQLNVPRSFQLCQGVLLLLLTSGILHALHLSTMEASGVLAACVAAASLSQRPWDGATLGAIATACLPTIDTTDDTHQLLWNYAGYGALLIAVGFLTPHVFKPARDRIRSTVTTSSTRENSRPDTND